MQIFLHFHKKDSHFCDKKLFAPKITCPKSVPVSFKFDMYIVGLRGIRTWEIYFVAENATTQPQWLLCLVQLLHIYIFFTTYMGQEWCGFESPWHQEMFCRNFLNHLILKNIASKKMQIFLHFHKKDSHFSHKKLFAPKFTCPKSVPASRKGAMLIFAHYTPPTVTTYL